MRAHPVLVAIVLLAIAPSLLAQQREAMMVRVGKDPGTLEAGHWDGGFFPHSTLALATYQLQRPARTPCLHHLPDGRLLVYWPEPTSRVAAIVVWDGNRMRETHAIPWVEGGAWVDGETWPGGWRIAANLSANGDPHPDLLAYSVVGPRMDPTWSYRILLGKPDGSFDISTHGSVVLSRDAYMCPMSAGDVNGDGLDDIAFHRYDTMTRFATRMQYLAGNGRGEFEAPGNTGALGEIPFGCTEPVLIDLDGDGDPDFFLPPDDDNDDSGQCVIVRDQHGDGREVRGDRFGAPTESIDIDPEDETESGILVSWARVGDLDGDGTLDLVIVTVHPGAGAGAREARYRVYRGLGGGKFELSGDAHTHRFGLGERPEALSWIGRRGVAAPSFPLPTAEDAVLRAGLVASDLHAACRYLTILLGMPPQAKLRVLGTIPTGATHAYASRALALLSEDQGEPGRVARAALEVLRERRCERR